MAAKSATERFDIACVAIQRLQEVSELMYEAAVYNSSVQKNLTELSSILSTSIQILDPDRSDEFVKKVNEAYLAKQAAKAGVTTETVREAMQGGYL
jgi:hypothetical protein